MAMIDVSSLINKYCTLAEDPLRVIGPLTTPASKVVYKYKNGSFVARGDFRADSDTCEELRAKYSLWDAEEEEYIRASATVYTPKTLLGLKVIPVLPLKEVEGEAAVVSVDAFNEREQKREFFLLSSGGRSQLIGRKLLRLPGISNGHPRHDV